MPTGTPDFCLNCHAPLAQGRYCAACGQDSRIRSRSLASLLYEAFQTLTDVDGRIWGTLRLLVFRPGRLTRLYMEGKRQRFLSPFQLYAIFSFFFFVAAFYIPGSDGRNFRERFRNYFGRPAGHNSARGISFSGPEEWSDTLIFSGNHAVFTLHSYDSSQRALPVEKRDGLAVMRIKRGYLSLGDRFRRGERESLILELADAFQSILPNLVIVLLPVFAFGLKLIYLRRNWYYADHLLFAVHLHVFGFLIFSLLFLLASLFPAACPDSGWVFLGLMAYSVFAFREFYRQGWLRTGFKFLLISVFYITCLLTGLAMALLLTPIMIET
jgi:hypothetical protein